MRVYLQGLASQLWHDEEAATAVEYAVMLALIIIACIAAISTFGQQQNTMWGNIKGELEAKGVGVGS